MEYLNNEICHVVTWLKASKLSRNVKKTKIVIFRPKQMKPLVTSALKIDNTVIQEVEHLKFLGVYIDQHLAWKTHINFACTKISKTIGMLYKARFFVTRKSLLLLYFPIVYPYVPYRNAVWSSTYPTNIKRIYSLQTRIVRTICAADYRAPSKPLSKTWHFLNSWFAFIPSRILHVLVLPRNVTSLFLKLISNRKSNP